MIVKEGTVLLRHLRFHAYHGVMEQERVVGNDYEVSLRLAYPLEKSCLSDDVNDTLNYAEVYDLVKKEMELPGRLLESVAYRIADRLMERFELISSVHITLYKINPPMGGDCEGAGVELHLTNNKEYKG